MQFKLVLHWASSPSWPMEEVSNWSPESPIATHTLPLQPPHVATCIHT